MTWELFQIINKSILCETKIKKLECDIIHLSRSFKH